MHILHIYTYYSNTYTYVYNAYTYSYRNMNIQYTYIYIYIIAGTSNKAEYFAKRQEEIKARETQANEIKKKYLTNGMKYTAQAMANR